MLESLVTSKTKRRILALFFANPKNDFYVREVCRKTWGQTNSVRSELGKLERAGILTSARRGNLLYYAANPKCPIHDELKGIVLKTEGAGNALRGAIAGGEGIKFAFIYGSYAKGEERAGSDIDILIIGKAAPEKISSLLREYEKRLGREINFSIYPEGEFLRAKGGGFISDALKGKKIMLVGEEDELERFAVGRSGQEG